MFGFLVGMFLLFNAAAAEAQIVQSAESVFANDVFVGVSRPTTLKYPRKEKPASQQRGVFECDKSQPAFDTQEYRDSVSTRFFAEYQPSIHLVDVDKPFQRIVVNPGDEIHIRLIEKSGTNWNYDLSGEDVVLLESRKLGNILTLVLQAAKPGAALLYLDRLSGTEVTAVRKVKIVVGR